MILDTLGTTVARPHSACEWPDLVTDPVSDYPRFEYSMKDVLRAGEALAGNLIWTDESAERIREVFRIANNFRDSHALPMRTIRYSLIGQIRSQKLKGVTAARLKRMPSVRRKLRAISTKLNQIQDLAGCRAVLPSIQDVNALIEAMRQKCPHELIREYPYITQPKADGYRCHHMIFKFRGDGETSIYNGRRVEIQVRTRLQHSWATAVEAVGLFRREDLKAGQGDSEWLRLFVLMSSEFSLSEGCVEMNASERASHVAEIIELSKKLDAVNMLENLRQAVNVTDNYVFDPFNKPDYFLIEYNRANSVVRVKPQFGAIQGVASYDQAEDSANSTGSTSNSITTVLVEVDEIESLKAAYPNYFGDVQLFKTTLLGLAEGKDGQEYALEPQQIAPKRPYEQPDLSWFKKKKRWFGKN